MTPTQGRRTQSGWFRETRWGTNCISQTGRRVQGQALQACCQTGDSVRDRWNKTFSSRRIRQMIERQAVMAGDFDRRILTVFQRTGVLDRVRQQ